MRSSIIGLIVSGFLLASLGTAWLGARQLPDGRDAQEEPTTGKIAWQYDTAG